jgi:hypothetical protein
MPRTLIRGPVISFDMGSRSIGFAFVAYPTRLLAWGIVDLGRHEATTATRKLVYVLNGELNWMRKCGADVVVEQQPNNGVCKTLSHCLQTYFATVDIEDGREPRRVFHFMKANNKLKYDMSVYNRIAPKNGKERKQVTMEVCERLLESAEPRLRDFYYTQKYKQQTDLADAYIQACRELQVRNKESSGTQVYHPGSVDSFSPTVPVFEEEEASDECASEIDFVS